jgi:hypothetical protein
VPPNCAHDADRIDIPAQLLHALIAKMPRPPRGVVVRAAQCGYCGAVVLQRESSGRVVTESYYSAYEAEHGDPPRSEPGSPAGWGWP